ncbi:MAG TPA: cytochrome c-type biogenesis protein [Polyangia bacterium]|nr:cytochrome c-type biogenesis protein [Polyangia bacterium]
MSVAALDPPATRGRRRAWFALGAAAIVVVAALVVVAIRGPAGPPTFQERVHDIASGLRCPVCQNLSVADSPSGIARQMRADIGLRLKEGQTESQIDAFFVAKYGHWILLTPSAGGIGFIVWLAPALAIAGGAWLGWTLVRRRRLAPAETVPADDEPRLTRAQREEIQREVDALDPLEYEG